MDKINNIVSKEIQKQMHVENDPIKIIAAVKEEDENLSTPQ